MDESRALGPGAGGEATDEVLNQSGDLGDANIFDADAALREAVAALGGDWASDRLTRAGAELGSRATRDLARRANRNPPELRTHDRFGHRIDEVDYHPAYHELMDSAFASGVHSLPWTEARPGAQVARAALSYLWNQAENGVCCPVAMTFAAVPTLRHDEGLARAWEARVVDTAYDPRPVPACEKRSVTVAMAMTEKQGGSDLRAITTQARADGKAGPGETYLLTGHKWFFSVPMADLFLTLARTDKGVSCFLAQGWLDDGRRNNLRIQRLKDKCGNRANASSEVEFNDLRAVMVGEDGRGIRTLIEMAHLTRMECAIGSAAIMRQALTQTLHHVAHRRAFQKSLLDQPLMRNVVADLALESEAAMWLSFRLAQALDDAGRDEGELLLGRVATPAAKYWICKRAPAVVAEALECHGGNGYVEDHLLARLYREAPLNGIWEGAGNVICLDVLRALQSSPEVPAALFAELRRSRGDDTRLDRHVDALERDLPDGEEVKYRARDVVERLAVALQASLLLRHAPAAVSEAFCASRLDGHGRRVFGTLPRGVDTRAVVERASLAAPPPDA